MFERNDKAVGAQRLARTYVMGALGSDMLAQFFCRHEIF